MTALQTAFAGFQPIINAVNKAFEFLVGSITKVIGGIGKLIGKLGGDAVKAEQEQVKRVDELQEAERQYTVEHAKNEAKISELRDKAADKEKYTAEQRKEFLEQAIACYSLLQDKGLTPNWCSVSRTMVAAWMRRW